LAFQQAIDANSEDTCGKGPWVADSKRYKKLIADLQTQAVHQDMKRKGGK